MKKSVELRQLRQGHIAAQLNLVEGAKEENGAARSLTEAETKTFNDEQERIDALSGEIVIAEKFEKNQRMAAAVSGTPTPRGEESEKKKVQERASIGAALRALAKGQPLNGAEKEMHQIGEEANRNAGVETPENTVLNIPMGMLRATAHTATEDSGEYGAALIQDQAPRMQMPYAPSTILERLGVTRLTGLTGGKVPLPVASNYDFDWLGETDEITIQKQKFEGPSLSPNRLGAAVEISNRLILQSSPDVEGMIRGLISSGYDRAINYAAINGSGTANQPMGLLNIAGVSVSSIVAGTAPSREAIVELQGILDVADASQGSLKYLYTHLLKSDLMARKADAGSGLYLQQTPNELAGYQAIASNFVPQLGGFETMIFGDWSKLFVGEWGALSVVSDPYGALLKNSMRLVLNGHADVTVAQPEAFAVNKFMNIN